MTQPAIQAPSRFRDDLDFTLMKARRVFLADAVTAESAERLIELFWYLDLKSPGEPIHFIIQSPGGSVDAGFAIWDQVKALKSPVTTIVTGMAASMGSVLSLVAPKGRRLATPNARIMIHQPRVSGVIRGQASDLEIHAQEIVKTRDHIIHIYMDATGKDYETISRAIDRDKWLTVDEAIEFGLIDQVIHSYADI